MEFRDWIHETFGDRKTIMDESVYSIEEIREDKVRLRHRRGRLRNEMADLETKYRRLLEKGARASEAERPQYAQRARIAKKKYKVKDQQFQKNSVQMATIVTVEGARELMAMSDEEDLNMPDMRDVDHQEVQQRVTNDMIQYELDMEVMLEVQDALDVDIIGSEASLEAGGQEEEIMAEIAADETSAENVDIEEDSAETEADGSTAGLGDGLDDDLDDLGGGLGGSSDIGPS
jgi:hypothetical protein